MNFASSVTREPIPYSSERGEEVLTLLDGLPAELCGLMRGMAGCSPYLAGLAQQERDWLRQVLRGSPDEAFGSIVQSLSACPPDDLGAGLRRAKRKIALLTAICDLGGIWRLEEVTGALTTFADLAVDLSIKAQITAELRRGKLPGLSDQDDPGTVGVVVLAMGKMGAAELNYSSDIDLICLFDENRYDPADYHDVRSSFIRATRRMSAQLSDLTGDGYVFRTDLRLRPDPSSTPVCLSMEAAERYYESVGRTWERAAHIKARPCGGDLTAGAAYLERLRPFIWRRHLDFAAIQDAHDMRLRIRDHKGLGGPITLPNHNMKLGRGGIREIEFFTQTRQIIAGGRDPSLRVMGTIEGLNRITEKGWVPEEAAATLSDHYYFHREVEHRLQMIGDAQTHDLPGSDDGFLRLAHFMGRTDVTRLKEELFDRLTEVHEVTESFFAPTEAEPESDALSESATTIVSRWRSYPALRSARARQIFRRVKPEILSRMNRAAKPEEALIQFDGFLSGLPAGVQLLSLFEANPHLIDLIVDICATSPALAQHLSRNSAVLDAVLGGSFFDEWPGAADLVAKFEDAMAASQDYEAKLDSVRRQHGEWHFRIGVHHLRGLIDAETAGHQYADLAEATLRALWPVVVSEFARKHGDQPGQGAVVLGMGSLGARQLNAQSDLDLIVIYDAEGAEGSDGKRPLVTRPYFARLTQALVTALTAPMAGGRLYEVDMRLRPSGRQGPVATSIQSFQSYQQDEAWTWEHLALTRARAVAGSESVGAEVESFRLNLLSENGAPEKVLPDVIDMRTRLAEAKPATTEWDVKLGAGGMQDIELLAQTGALLSGCAAHGVAAQLAGDWLSEADRETLTECYRLQWQVQISAKLLSGKPLNMDEIGEGGRALILRETGSESIVKLQETLMKLRMSADEIVTQRLNSQV